MFEGGGYGVGATVNALEPMPWDDVPPPPGVDAHPSRLGELMPVSARTQAERAAELERVVLVEGQLAAYKAEIVASLARVAPTPAARPMTTTTCPAWRSSSPTSSR